MAMQRIQSDAASRRIPVVVEALQRARRVMLKGSRTPRAGSVKSGKTPRSLLERMPRRQMQKSHSLQRRNQTLLPLCLLWRH
jgi:hypothetical protein